MGQRTLFFKKAYDISSIIKSCASIAKSQGVGTTAADILNALHTGVVILRPAKPSSGISMDAANLSLTQLLDRAATKLEDQDPALAGEMQRRKALLNEAL